MSNQRAMTKEQEDAEMLAKIESANPRKVHHRDRRGNMMKKTPYTAYVKNGTTYIEKPAGSGNLFHENMEPAGRVERVIDEKTGVIAPKFDFEAEHKEFKPAPTGAEQIQLDLAAEKQKSALLERELAAIKAEQAKIADLVKSGDEEKPAIPETAKPEPEAAKPAQSGPPKLTKG